jgi:hypothetical protein
VGGYSHGTARNGQYEKTDIGGGTRFVCQSKAPHYAAVFLADGTVSRFIQKTYLMVRHILEFEPDYDFTCYISIPLITSSLASGSILDTP